MKRFWDLRKISVIIALLFAAGTAIIVSGSARKAVPAAARTEDKRTLVIDAGHGGMDGGAVSGGGLKESEVNLAIAQRLFDLCRAFGLDCAMTRFSEALDYPPEAKSVREKKQWDLRRRAGQANDTPFAVLLSIHQNRYPDARPSGTQVFYAPTEGSERFAALTHDNLISCLCPENRRVCAPASGSIYLMKNVDCPAILVECGFLSNPEEAGKLADPAYQTGIAAVLCASYIQYLAPVS